MKRELKKLYDKMMSLNFFFLCFMSVGLTLSLIDTNIFMGMTIIGVVAIELNLWVWYIESISLEKIKNDKYI